MLPLTVLLPPRARIAPGGWVVVDLPCYYASKENSKSEGVERKADSKEECAKKKQ